MKFRLSVMHKFAPMGLILRRIAKLNLRFSAVRLEFCRLGILISEINLRRELKFNSRVADLNSAPYKFTYRAL